MAKASFRCTIVTPSEAVFDDEVSYVSFPAWDGQQGVMVNQSPLLTRLGFGPMRVDLVGASQQGGVDGRSETYWVDGGFARVSDTGLTILTERAALAGDLNGDDWEAELRAANEAAVSGGGTTENDRRRVEAAQARARSKRAMAARKTG